MLTFGSQNRDLAAALAEAQAAVRRQPERADLRTGLFQLYAVLGLWDKAGTQLTTVGQLDASALPMVQMYSTALNCERLRESVFAGKKSPIMMGDPPEWMAGLLQALALDAQGHGAQAAMLRQRALECATPRAGEIDGHAFTWLADADSRLGPVLEVYAQGKYYWLPCEHIRQLVIEAPADLRDLIWLPATLTLVAGGELVVLLPVTYPGSAAQADNDLRLARRTDWLEQAGGTYFGLGQRMLVTDGNDYPLLDVRKLVFADA